MVPLMVDPSRELHTVHGVPRSVLAEARRSPDAVQLRKDSGAKLRRLCRELGLLTPAARWVWARCGLWDGDDHPSPGAGA